MPVVSIVTCTYNRSALLRETITAVLAQTFRDFEYIIVDDGSEDDTAAVVASFGDSRIRYIYHERTGGHLSRLRNFAQKHCLGRYVAYVDSDDLWEPEKLARQIGPLEASPETGFSFTNIVMFNEQGTMHQPLYRKTGSFTGRVFDELMRNELIICHTTLVIRCSCLEIVGPMDESLHSGDHDRVFFLSRHFDALILYDPLVRVRKHAGNSTGNNKLSLRLLKEHHHTLHKLLQQKLITRRAHRIAMASTSYSFGVQSIRMHEPAEARRYFRLCLSLQPFHLKAWWRLARLLTQ